MNEWCACLVCTVYHVLKCKNWSCYFNVFASYYVVCCSYTPAYMSITKGSAGEGGAAAFQLLHHVHRQSWFNINTVFELNYYSVNYFTADMLMGWGHMIHHSQPTLTSPHRKAFSSEPRGLSSEVWVYVGFFHVWVTYLLKLIWIEIILIQYV